jgi:hypothetical protein
MITLIAVFLMIIALCLPFNPSGYSEDRLRSFSKVAGSWF